jgi:hypothetical protein
MIELSIYNPTSPTKAGIGPNSKRVMLTSAVKVWGVSASDGSSINELLPSSVQTIESWANSLRFRTAIAVDSNRYAAQNYTTLAPSSWYQLRLQDTGLSPERRMTSLVVSVTLSKTKVRAVGRRTSPPDKATFFFLAMDKELHGTQLNLDFVPYMGMEPILLLQSKGFLLGKEMAARFMPVMDPNGLDAMFGFVIDDPEDFFEFGIHGMDLRHFLTEESIFVNPISEEEKIVVVATPPKRKRKLLLKKK